MGKFKTPGAGPVRRDARRGTAAEKGHGVWLYGLHAVAAALTNPMRQVRRLVATAEGAAKLSHMAPDASPDILDRQALERLLPPGAVHQGVALSAEALAQPDLEGIVVRAGDAAVVVILDQVTDPHNIGAVLRSAAAFGALAVIQCERGAPSATGIVAKSASGALEFVPLVTVTNISRTLDRLKAAAFWCIGLDGTADRTLAEASLSGRIALVLGAEGKGLRRLTREHCDLLAHLPTRPPITSLNVSNAAAVALYELVRER
ncbi:MAG: 23S rRNA (guanosine(2251)-2'-O)-methyltransferase RlmB [Alphaproteobacteria bacterium]|nr:23S rRNA (guanosine(2251)-2'-O)-methyltransferase RlmB [Alphaproteobacteria bacterium]